MQISLGLRSPCSGRPQAPPPGGYVIQLLVLEAAPLPRPAPQNEAGFFSVHNEKDVDVPSGQHRKPSGPTPEPEKDPSIPLECV